MKSLKLTVALILSSCSFLAFAGGTGDAQPETQQQAKAAGSEADRSDKETLADPQRMVCKLEVPTGSLIKNRVCKTALQWQDEREHSRKMMEDLQARTAGPTHGN
jgi:hypothetical protein